MIQRFTRNGCDVLRVTGLTDIVTLELVPRPNPHLPTVELMGEGEAIAEFLAKNLPRDTIHAILANLK